MATNILKCAALTGLTAFLVFANHLTARANIAVPNSDELTYEAAVEPLWENPVSSNQVDSSSQIESIAPNPFDLALSEIDWVDDWEGSVEPNAAAMDIAATPATDPAPAPPPTDFTSEIFLNLDETFEASLSSELSPMAQTVALNDDVDEATVSEAAIPEEMPLTAASTLVRAPIEPGSVAVESTVPLADAVDSTSAIDLVNQPTQAQSTAPTTEGLEVPATPTDPTEADTSIAQVIAPGQPTRSGPSYIGAGGNIGFGGSTGIGRGNFALFSKLGLTNNFSLRPAAFIGDRTTFLVPVTLDFPTGALIDDAVPFSIAPYVGGGIGISTGDDSRVRPVIVAGVDAPVTSQFTATAGVTVGFFRNTEVGLMLGIGYNFGGF